MATKKATVKKVKITLKKSTIGCTKGVIATVEALGLKKVGYTVEKELTPQIEGMIFKVKHLLSVEEV